MAVKKLSAFLISLLIIFKTFFFFFSFLICLCSFRIKNKLESHKKICENKDFSSVEMPSEDTKILEFNQYQKFDEAPFIIYANLE